MLLDRHEKPFPIIRDDSYVSSQHIVDLNVSGVYSENSFFHILNLALGGQYYNALFSYELDDFRAYLLVSSSEDYSLMPNWGHNYPSVLPIVDFFQDFQFIHVKNNCALSVDVDA